jgi:hypothetical protein
MVEMARVTVNWTGFNGAPGYTNLYFRDFETNGIDQAIADGAAAKVDTWLGAWDDFLPPSVAVQVDPTVEVIEATNGALLRFITVPAKPLRQGAGTGSYSAASGAVVNWYTDGVRNGRRIRGRSFMVPLAGNALATDGTLSDTALTTWRTATTTLISATGAGDMGVWARPSAPAATDGSWTAASAFTIPDKAAVLRSRRD